ncbi:MAG TPA: DUF4337 domain-containing protein [Polyangia bacterium]|nr:DUF4337 domain-containing protein [Polyangia bacterium]
MANTDEDIQELIREIHADRVAAKDKERREGWTRYVSLMVVVLAVATAIGSLKGAGFGSRVMLKQSQASDTWALYQAKSIKQRVAELEARGSDPALAAKAAEDVRRYGDEQKTVEAKALSLEAERDEAARHGPPLGFGIASLQISIALASVCLITKRKGLWGASGLLGLVGVGYVVYGLFFV